MLTSDEDGGWRKPGTVTVIFLASSNDGNFAGVVLCLWDIGPGSLLREGRLEGGGGGGGDGEGSSTRIGFIGEIGWPLVDWPKRLGAEEGLLAEDEDRGVVGCDLECLLV